MEHIKDDIDIEIERKRKAVVMSAMKTNGVVLAVYLLARLAQWLLNFPKTLDGINILVLLFAGLWYVGIVDNYVETFILEFRLRAKRIDDRIASLQSSLSSASRDSAA